MLLQSTKFLIKHCIVHIQYIEENNFRSKPFLNRLSGTRLKNCSKFSYRPMKLARETLSSRDFFKHFALLQRVILLLLI